ncbi:MAG: hypothetical protein K1X44_05640 [Alphaproteobacteria bacterium]|nr:hypothetical protein [Alphaproteobacteria bacterium]
MIHLSDSKDLIAYLAAPDYEHTLEGELDHIITRYGRLFLCSSQKISPVWAINTWYNPIFLEIDSIKHAGRLLKSIQRNWAGYQFHLFRRAKLIEDHLPVIKFKPWPFPFKLPTAPLGSWCLIEPDLILAASQCSSPFPHGEIHFVENKNEPPSRAYLKLWEIFSKLQIWPKIKEKCIDFGSSPGSWSWVLAKLGTEVISIDKAPLVPNISKMSNINYINASAFSIQPKDIGPVDWIFADIACYPERLFKLVTLWLESGLCQRFICTIKFQGKDNYDIIKKFQAIPHSTTSHLFHNKHEATWVYLKE